MYMAQGEIPNSPCAISLLHLRTVVLSFSTFFDVYLKGAQASVPRSQPEYPEIEYVPSVPRAMVQNKEREAEWSELTGILCVCFRVVGNPETMLSNDDSHSASNCTKTGLKASSE